MYDLPQGELLGLHRLMRANTRTQFTPTQTNRCTGVLAQLDNTLAITAGGISPHTRHTPDRIKAPSPATRTSSDGTTEVPYAIKCSLR